MNDPRLLAYVAAAGAALGAAGSAEATVVYSGVQNKSYSNSNENFTLTKAGGLGGSDFNVAMGAIAGTSNGVNFASAFVQSGGNNGSLSIANSGRFALNFINGNTIAAASWGSNHKLFSYSAGNKSTGGNFNNNKSSGYLGLKFTTQGGDKYYGWMFIDSVHVGDGNSTPSSFRVVDWAYQDAAGVSINAGEGAPSNAVPEPTSCALALIAMGAGGLAVHRRRRQEQQVSEAA